MRHKIASAVLALGLATAAVVPGAAASSALSTTPACEVTWGSLAKTRTAPGMGTAHAIRAGRHACFDRLVITLDGPVSSIAYSVRYVDHIHDDAGAAVPLLGTATIEVAFKGYRFHPEDRAHVDVTGFRTFREVASGRGGSGAGAPVPGVPPRRRGHQPARGLQPPGRGCRTPLVTPTPQAGFVVELSDGLTCRPHLPGSCV